MEKGILSGFSLHTLKSMLIGLGAALLAMLVLSGLISLIVYLTPMMDSNLVAFAIITPAIAIFGGSFLAARIHGSRGLLLGLATGILLFLLMLILGSNVAISPLLKLGYCALCGMAGGFWGIK